MACDAQTEVVGMPCRYYTCVCHRPFRLLQYQIRAIKAWEWGYRNNMEMGLRTAWEWGYRNSKRMRLRTAWEWGYRNSMGMRLWTAWEWDWTAREWDYEQHGNETMNRWEWDYEQCGNETMNSMELEMRLQTPWECVYHCVQLPY